MKTKHIPMRALSAALIAVTAAGCATTRSEPDANGVAWPAPEDSYLKQGAFLAPAQFPLIKPGLTKDQVQLVLGLPHFTEGLAGVRDWNYRFNFHTQTGVLGCQYQVQYDDEARVKASHWRTSECDALVQSAAGGAVSTPVAATTVPRGTAAAPASSAPQPVTVLFDFARAEPLSIQARHDIAAMAARLKQRTPVPALTVTGHADRVGDAERNRALSQARAHQVADALVAGGIAAERIEVIARGSTEPVSDCPQDAALTAELLSCLQPDRRVTVRAGE